MEPMKEKMLTISVPQSRADPLVVSSELQSAQQRLQAQVDDTHLSEHSHYLSELS
jgi:hypothetical protein